MTYYVYLLQCSDKSFYCGYTNNLERRIKQHNNSEKGAKYTRAKRPNTLKYFEKFSTLREALKREYKIKQLTHLEKKLLIEEYILNV
jgi:putative endonuclease